MGPPGALSWQATCAGNTAARRSSERIRAMGAGMRFPLKRRGMARARVAFQRHRTRNIGAWIAAWASTSSTSDSESSSKMDSSGNECCGPSDRSTPSSVAAACSSKSNRRQKRLRSPSPRARLVRAPNGACRTSCIPPASSKNRSATSVRCVGTTPRTARVAARYSTTCRAPAAGTAHSASSQAAAAAGSASRGSSSSRRRETSADSSRLRPGASAIQNGIPGASPWASSTRTDPASIRRMRQEVLPRRNTSPATDSTAKSSSTCPTGSPSGSATTVYCEVSGIAPPPVSAAIRAPRRPFTRPFTASRWRSAVVRPGEVAIPSESMSTTASNSARERARYGQARRTSPKSRSRWIGAADASATICCARTSRGRSGIRISSSAPRRRPRATAAHSTSSSRLIGNRRPFGTPPFTCAARPIRWSATWSAPGVPSWTTRSTSPTSMPSSSDAVATTARSRPALSRSSAWSRRARESEPWWAATASSPSRSASACVARSASRRVFTKTSVERCSPTSAATRS